MGNYRGAGYGSNKRSIYFLRGSIRVKEFNYALCHMFPFSSIPKNASVVIWGTGNVGSQYYAELVAANYTGDIKWVDSNSVADLNKFVEHNKNSYIVVAMLSEGDRFDVANKLIAAGMDSTYIISDCPNGMVLTPTNVTRVVDLSLNYFNDDLRKNIQRFHELLSIMNVNDCGFIRIGDVNDGGYVMVDDLPGGVAYSIGICNDVSWDLAMSKYGYDIYMYDHTIEDIPERNEKFHFTKQGITGYEETERLKRLATFLKINHHEKMNNMILKMDVEGAEWGVFESMPEKMLSQFAQIVVEFHGMLKFDKLLRYNSILEKINSTHQVVHYHINNCGKVLYINGQPYANTIEVTFVRKQSYSFEEVDINLPRNEDAPNWKEFPEIEIGLWNRKDYYGA